MILLPGTHHYITWTKQNLLDSATYYPQAVIKDKRNDTTLDTLNLASLGSNRYGTSWLVPQDPTGQGREVSIVITVYEDSGYSVVSGMYGAWETDYLIYSLKQQGSGGGGSFDYNIVRKIVSDELGKLEKPEQVDLTEIFNEVSGVKKSLGSRLKELLAIKDKTDRIEAVEERILATLKELGVSTKVVEKSMSEKSQEAVSLIEQATNNSINAIQDVVSSSEGRLSERTDKEMKYIISQFKAIMEQEAINLASKLDVKIDAIDKQLAKPLTFSMNRYDESEEKKSSGKDRLINYLNA